MPRRRTLFDLWLRQAELAAQFATTGAMAGMVVAARLPMLAAQTMAPTPKGRREAERMVTEKTAALAAGATAAALQVARGGPPATPIAAAHKALAVTAAATRAGRSRVRGNARRLCKPKP